jgi:hypothetical protein
LDVPEDLLTKRPLSVETNQDPVKFWGETSLKIHSVINRVAIIDAIISRRLKNMVLFLSLLIYSPFQELLLHDTGI